MGKRKLRFDTRKNYERKRAKQRKICPSFESMTNFDTATGDSPIDDSPLIVSLPLSLFTSSAVSSLFQLARRCGNQLKEWRLSSWQTENDLHAISLSKICRGNPFTVIISADFNWSFFIGSTSICLQQCTCLASLISTHLNSVDLVGQLVTYIE